MGATVFGKLLSRSWAVFGPKLSKVDLVKMNANKNARLFYVLLVPVYFLVDPLKRGPAAAYFRSGFGKEDGSGPEVLAAFLED